MSMVVGVIDEKSKTRTFTYTNMEKGLIQWTSDIACNYHTSD
jgi:hypothetical protein